MKLLPVFLYLMESMLISISTVLWFIPGERQLNKNRKKSQSLNCLYEIVKSTEMVNFLCRAVFEVMESICICCPLTCV